ncbi:hypothetical protein M8494_19435 [Serratia ureilytica]
MLPAPLLGEIPHLPQAERAPLGQYLDIGLLTVRNLAVSRLMISHAGSYDPALAFSGNAGSYRDKARHFRDDRLNVGMTWVADRDFFRRWR